MGAVFLKKSHWGHLRIKVIAKGIFELQLLWVFKPYQVFVDLASDCCKI